MPCAPELPSRWDTCVYFYRLYPLPGLGGCVTASCLACLDRGGVRKLLADLGQQQAPVQQQGGEEVRIDRAHVEEGPRRNRPGGIVGRMPPEELDSPRLPLQRARSALGSFSGHCVEDCVR